MIKVVTISVIFKDNAEKFIGSAGVDFETVEQLLYITRTYYTLQNYSLDGNISWNLAFTGFDAFFQLTSIGNELGLSCRGHFKSPLPHHNMTIIL